MRIVIISRNTYPHQSPRGFRTAELSEELARRGYDVAVYSITGEYDYSKYTADTGVQIRKIRTLFDKNANDNSRHPSFIDRILVRLFSRVLFFPDIELLFKVPGILRKESDCDLLITIAYPHTIHWGAALYKKFHSGHFPRIWISDCGDPYYLNPFVKAPVYFKPLEKLSCRLTDFITIPTRSSIDGYFKEFHSKIRIVPQGFNFEKTPIASYTPNEIVTFAFAGAVYNGKRDPRPFMDYLLDSGLAYKFILYLRAPLEEKYLSASDGRIEYRINYQRKDIIRECSQFDFLINITNPSSVQSPSKLIDYGISKRPILDISTLCNEDDQCRFLSFYKGDYSQSHTIEIGEYSIERVANGFLALSGIVD